MKYLLAAEADRIQDLIFRSSRLREVVGGSQLLTRFCDEAPALLASRMGIEANVITRGGGSFRVEFENEDGDRAKGDALRFGAALAEAYNRATGGTLSVAKPVKIADDSAPAWKKASKDAGENLRRAKRQGPPVATPHIPYIAFCESCGVGLAEAHEVRFGEGRGHYLCPACRTKTAEREEKGRGTFLKRFYEKVAVGMDWPSDLEDVAQYDPRDYVAYIVADGDGMGRIFDACSRDQAQALSGKMDEALREALAEPTRKFMSNVAANRNPRLIPVLPLILGGDDLFALVPAPWALDIARRLCHMFQNEMTEFVQKEGIKIDREQDDNRNLTVTMSAAVVICKANYPYYLAHQIGEERLSETKRAVKALADQGLRLSAVDFEIVTGGKVEPKELTGKWRSTLRPYWVTGKKEGNRETEEGKKERERIEKSLHQGGWGLPICMLLEQRLALVDTPSRRLSLLRDLFDRVPAPGDADARQRWDDDWDDEMKRLLKRIERDWTQKRKHPVRAALDTLGGVEIKEWYRVERKSDDDRWQGHGLPDLLRVWEWALDLKHDPVEYEGGGR